MQKKLDAENKMQLALCIDQDAYNYIDAKFIKQRTWNAIIGKRSRELDV